MFIKWVHQCYPASPDRNVIGPPMGGSNPPPPLFIHFICTIFWWLSLFCPCWTLFCTVTHSGIRLINKIATKHRNFLYKILKYSTNIQGYSTKIQGYYWNSGMSFIRIKENSNQIQEYSLRFRNISRKVGNTKTNHEYSTRNFLIQFRNILLTVLEVQLLN